MCFLGDINTLTRKNLYQLEDLKVQKVDAHNRQEDSESFPDELYDKIDSFLDRESLFFTLPEFAQKPKNSVKLTKIPSFTTIDTTSSPDTSMTSEPENNNNLKEIPSILARRARSSTLNKKLILESLIPEREIQSEASIFSTLNIKANRSQN